MIWHDKTWTLNGIFLWGGGVYWSRMAMNNMFIRKKSMIYCFGKFGVTFLPPDKERVLWNLIRNWLKRITGSFTVCGKLCCQILSHPSQCNTFSNSVFIGFKKNSKWGVDNRIIKICYILLNGNKYKKICIRHSLRNFNNKNKPICESCQNLEKKNHRSVLCRFGWKT